MKKLLLAVVLMLGVATVSAQEVGSIWIGGTAGFASTKVGDGDRETSYKFIPEIGYVLSDNLGMGIKVGYQKADGLEIAGEEISGETKAIVVNPFVRYSFLKGDIGSLFIDGGVAYGNYDIEEVDDKLNAFEVGLRPGVAINVTNKISVLGNFGFLGYQNLKQGDVKADSFGLDLDMTQFTVGVNIFF